MSDATDSALGADTATESELTAKPNVLFSIPPLRSIGDELFSASHFDHETSVDDVAQVISPTAIVPLSVPDANPLQTFVHGAKQRFIDLAGGSVFWRLFVGSGVAIFFVAVTLILFGPNPARVGSDETADSIGKLRPVDPGAVTQADGSRVAGPKSAIQLTVSASANGGRAEPAEFDDPFVAANQVPAKVAQAMHYTDPLNGLDETVIQPVSHPGTQPGQPAWLTGTIDVDDAENADPLQR